MTTLEARLGRIREKLKELTRRDTGLQVFGAGTSFGHGYERRPTFTETEIVALEMSFGVELPTELRQFLSTVHGGGAGPGYGFFLTPDAVPRARRSRPFPFGTSDARVVIARRLAGGKTRWETLRAPNEDSEEDDDYPPGPGFVPLAHQGCGVFDVIVVTGEQRGFMWWYDNAWGPCYARDGSPWTFLDWYETWLDNGLKSLSESPR